MTYAEEMIILFFVFVCISIYKYLKICKLKNNNNNNNNNINNNLVYNQSILVPPTTQIISENQITNLISESTNYSLYNENNYAISDDHITELTNTLNNINNIRDELNKKKDKNIKEKDNSINKYKILNT